MTIQIIGNAFISGDIMERHIWTKKLQCTLHM